MNAYSVSSDVAGQAADAELLRQEIADSGFVAGFDGITIRGDEIVVSGSVVDQAGLDALILNHSTYSLPRARAAKVAAVDARTREIIAAGFSFDGNSFSLSQQAQMNWLGLVTLQDLFAWPMGVTNDADATYTLSHENLIPFIAAGSGVVAAAVGSGRALKVAANAAANQGELDAVVDAR